MQSPDGSYRKRLFGAEGNEEEMRRQERSLATALKFPMPLSSNDHRVIDIWGATRPQDNTEDATKYDASDTRKTCPVPDSIGLNLGSGSVGHEH